MKNPKVWLRLLALVSLIGAAVTAKLLGLDQYAEPEALQAWLLGSGVWGPVAYVCVYFVGYLLQVPGVFFVIAAGLTWPLQKAIPLALFASVCASLGAFTFARYVARDWVQPRIPAKLRVWDERLEENGLWTVIILRLLMFLSPPVTYMLGVSRIPLSTYMIGTGIGMLPGIAMFTVGASTYETWSEQIPIEAWIGLGAVVVLGIGARVLFKRRARRATEEGADPA